MNLRAITSLVAILVIAAFLAACAAFQKAEPFLPSPSQSECVLNGVEAGKPALSIIGECGLEANAIGYIESLLLGQKRKVAHAKAALADGGADASTEAGK